MPDERRPGAATRYPGLHLRRGVRRVYGRYRTRSDMSLQTKELSMSDDQPTDVVAALSDGAYTLFVADFADTDTALAAYEALKSIEDGRTLEIDGVIVVSRAADGTLEIQKATDHSTRHGLKWGVVGGVALGLIFPPSIIGSAAVLGAVGAATGKARELQPPQGPGRGAARTRSSPGTPGSSRWSPTRVRSRSARRWRRPTRSSRRRSTRSRPTRSRPRRRRPRPRPAEPRRQSRSPTSAPGAGRRARRGGRRPGRRGRPGRRRRRPPPHRGGRSRRSGHRRRPVSRSRGARSART